MALVLCPECKKEVSDKAVTCIHCGYPLCENVTQITTNSQPKDMYCPKCKKIAIVNELYCDICGEYLINIEDENKNEKTNALAIAGLVISLLSLLISLWGLVAILGIALSTIGNVQINNTGQKGRISAIAGQIIGFGSFVYTAYQLITAYIEYQEIMRTFNIW